jgi:hypothetical protein
MDVELIVMETGATGFAEEVEFGVVENFVESLVEGVAWCCGQLPAVPQVLLSLSHFPRAHSHTSMVNSKYFKHYTFWDFKHGLIKDQKLLINTLAGC